MIAGIIGMAVVFTGILQISQLGDAAVANLLEARTDAMTNADDQLAQESQSMENWDTGDDGLDTTADDEVVRGNSGQINPMIAELGSPTSMQPLVRQDWMLNELNLGTGFAANLYKGEHDTKIPLEPALKKILNFIDDEIKISDEVYMPGLTIDYVGGNNP